MELPILIGTEKQIKWGEDIRKNFLSAAEKELKKMTKRLEQSLATKTIDQCPAWMKYYPEWVVELKLAIEKVEKEKTAKNLIENRYEIDGILYQSSKECYDEHVELFKEEPKKKAKYWDEIEL